MITEKTSPEELAPIIDTAPTAVVRVVPSVVSDTGSRLHLAEAVACEVLNAVDELVAAGCFVDMHLTRARRTPHGLELIIAGTKDPELEALDRQKAEAAAAEEAPTPGPELL